MNSSRGKGIPLVAVIAGGGTDGHTAPALATANALVAMGVAPLEIRFIGSSRGTEAERVGEAGFDFVGLGGRGIVRSLAPKMVLQNVVSAMGLVSALVTAWWLLVRRRPRVVISMGGFAGLCPALAAVSLRIPLVLAESNAVPGAANRVVSRFAAGSATSFEGVRLRRARVTGNPVRPQILDVDRGYEARRLARLELGIDPDRVLIGVIGGSLGSARINKGVKGLVEEWSARCDIAVHHAVGSRDWLAYSASLPVVTPGGIDYQAVEFEKRMELVYSAADLLVCRAGGSTCAEVTVVGVPSIMVPLPNAPQDHQSANAAALARVGASVAIADSEFTTERLVAELSSLVGDKDLRFKMEAAAKAAGHPQAANSVAELAMELAR